MALPDNQVVISKPQSVSDAIDEKYYPSLNGLRGISIIIVLMAHLHLSRNPIYLRCFNGALGVDIFFVLSGFLITSICLKEYKLTGNLLLKNFYVRRILRIIPVAYLYIVAIIVLNILFKLQIPYFQFINAALFLMNSSYFQKHNYTPELVHYWSLSVEEQFYIIFPFILKKSFSVFFIYTLLIVLLLPIFCGFQLLFKIPDHGYLYLFMRLLFKFQAIAVGCLLAMLAFKKHLNYKWLLCYRTIGNLAAVFIILYLQYDPWYGVKAVYTNLIISSLIAYIIISNIVPSRGVIFKLLNSRWLSFIGLLSYSIYIWQEVFTFGSSKLPWYMITFPYNLVFILGISCLSYFFFEKYFLKLKHKFSKLKTADELQLQTKK